MYSNKIKLAEQALAAHKAKLPSAGPETDQVLRQIAAAQSKLDELRAAQRDLAPPTT
jgi:phage shock protein A